MLLVMTRSADGFLCRGPRDDMRWTGPRDKALFKLLTLVSVFDDGVVLAGSATVATLPPLPGRRVIRITREAGRDARGRDRRDVSYLSKLREEGACTLEDAAACFPGAPLVGGPTVALAAVRLGAVDRGVVTTVDARLGGHAPVGDAPVGLVPAAPLLDALTEALGSPRAVATVPETLVWRRA